LAQARGVIGPSEGGHWANVNERRSSTLVTYWSLLKSIEPEEGGHWTKQRGGAPVSCATGSGGFVSRPRKTDPLPHIGDPLPHMRDPLHPRQVVERVVNNRTLLHQSFRASGKRPYRFVLTRWCSSFPEFDRAWGVGKKRLTWRGTCPLPPDNYAPARIHFRSLDNLSLTT
jgi:hypothetical protein